MQSSEPQFDNIKTLNLSKYLLTSQQQETVEMLNERLIVSLHAVHKRTINLFLRDLASK